MHWEIQNFEGLSKANLYSFLKLRSEVFVVEQKCIYNDLDDLDLYSFHIFKKESGNIVAYARILPAGTRFKEVSIGRVVVKTDSRGKGLGIKLMQKSH